MQSFVLRGSSAIILESTCSMIKYALMQTLVLRTCLINSLDFIITHIVWSYWGRHRQPDKGSSLHFPWQLGIHRNDKIQAKGRLFRPSDTKTMKENKLWWKRIYVLSSFGRKVGHQAQQTMESLWDPALPNGKPCTPSKIYRCMYPTGVYNCPHW